MLHNASLTTASYSFVYTLYGKPPVILHYAIKRPRSRLALWATVLQKEQTLIYELLFEQKDQTLISELLFNPPCWKKEWLLFSYLGWVLCGHDPLCLMFIVILSDTRFTPLSYVQLNQEQSMCVYLNQLFKLFWF